MVSKPPTAKDEGAGVVLPITGRGDDALHCACCAQRHRPRAQRQSARVSGWPGTAAKPVCSAPGTQGAAPSAAAVISQRGGCESRVGPRLPQGRLVGLAALMCHWPKLGTCR